MIVWAGAILGIAVGLVTAKRRGGNGLDLAQYAAGFGIAFAILGLFVTVLIDRLY